MVESIRLQETHLSSFNGSFHAQAGIIMDGQGPGTDPARMSICKRYLLATSCYLGYHSFSGLHSLTAIVCCRLETPLSVIVRIQSGNVALDFRHTAIV